MKLQIFLFACVALIFTSCGSNKAIVRTSPRVLNAPEVTNTPMEKITPSNLPELKPIVKKRTKNSDITQAYIEEFAAIAVREMHTYKIPASITLAQGVLESGSGKSLLAIRSNNHFGIKCHTGWKGKSVRHDDDAIGECFRKYQHPEVSYKDHSKFLTSRKRYANLFKLKATDYKGWAYGLKRAGYATDKKYPNKLIAIIKKYNLAQYDFTEKQPKPKEVVNEPVVVANTPKNDQIIHTVRKGDTLYSIAKTHQITVKKLKEVNGLYNNTISIGQELILY